MGLGVALSNTVISHLVKIIISQPKYCSTLEETRGCLKPNALTIEETRRYLKPNALTCQVAKQIQIDKEVYSDNIRIDNQRPQLRKSPSSRVIHLISSDINVVIMCSCHPCHCMKLSSVLVTKFKFLSFHSVLK